MKTTLIFLIVSILIVSILNSSCQKQTNYSPQINSLQASLISLQNRCDSLANALNKTNTNLQTTNNTLNNLGDSIISIQSKVVSIVNQISSLNLQLSGTNANITLIDSKITNLNTQLNNLLLELNALLTQQSIAVDIDGNVYHPVTIGTQIWMVENLKVTHYRDGSVIPIITDPTSWGSLTSGAWCDYLNVSSNGTTYGHLYNWYSAADSRNIAPIGWHVATDAEWTTLTNFLGGANIAGGELKEAGTSHWNNPNVGATNSSGFTALPAGHRYGDGSFLYLGGSALWWTSTEFSASIGWLRYLNVFDSVIYRGNITNKVDGLSIRCIKD